jgi:uncharacterized protein YrrD
VTRVVRARDLLTKPVVTLEGDDVAEVRDVVYDSAAGTLLGFTLNKRGWFGGRLRERLPMDSVHSIGKDAVMVGTQDDLVDANAAPDAVAVAPSDRDVIGDAVLTESGTNLGEVSDVVLTLGAEARAVGYEITTEHRTVYIPLPEQHAVSGDALVVPDEVDSFVHDDLAGFGASVPEYRAQLREENTDSTGTAS